jgi:hypothetical protein
MAFKPHVRASGYKPNYPSFQQRELQNIAREIAFQCPESRDLMFKAVTFVALGCAIYAAWEMMNGQGQGR